MSLRLTKPGLSVAARVYPPKHSLAGQEIKPIGYTKRGTPVWPMFGASDDPDDPSFTGEGGREDEDDDSDEDDENEEEDRKPSRKSKKSKSEPDEDDDEDDDDDEDPRYLRAQRKEKRYRLQLREAEKANADLQKRLQALENRDKDPDEVTSAALSDAKSQIQSLTDANRVMTAQLAFFKSNTVSWVDASDAFALAEREGLFDDVIDEDGNVDDVELRRGLRDLAKRKKHLVKSDESPKGRSRKTKDEDDEDDDDEDETGSRKSGSTMNSTRKGKRQAGPTRDQLAAKFPVLRNRF